MRYFLYVLSLILIVLKLLGISALANVSWWLVFLPALIAFVLPFMVVLIAVIALFIIR